MYIVILVTFCFLNSCFSNFSIVTYPNLDVKFDKYNLPDDNVSITYRNGETFIGKIDKEKNPYLGLILNSRTKKLIHGISIGRGIFNYSDNGRPEWCIEGDCYNGKGKESVEYKYHFYRIEGYNFTIESNGISYIVGGNPENLKNRKETIFPDKFIFSGDYKDFNIQNGTLSKDGIIFFNVVDGKILPSEITLDIKEKVMSIVKPIEERKQKEQERKQKEYEKEYEENFLKSKAVTELLENCRALHEDCRTDRYVKQIKLNHSIISCYKKDYNDLRYIKIDNINMYEVYYKCIPRGYYNEGKDVDAFSTKSIRIFALGSKNSNEPSLERCTTNYKILGIEYCNGGY